MAVLLVRNKGVHSRIMRARHSLQPSIARCHNIPAQIGPQGLLCEVNTAFETLETRAASQRIDNLIDFEIKHYARPAAYGRDLSMGSRLQISAQRPRSPR